MLDQANKLREMVQRSKELDSMGSTIIKAPDEKPKNSARVITVTSGKGGVGKTNLTVNLGIQLARQNKRVVILDADFGLANIDVLFGIVSKHSFADVIMGDKTIQDVMMEGPNGIHFVSGGSGLGELANITEKQMSYLLDNFGFLDTVADVVLIDTGAGISKSVINFIKASNETIIITTSEPTSVTDAYAIIKTVKEEKSSIPEFKIVVNRVDSQKEGEEVFDKLNMVSQRFLDISLCNLGSIPNDNNLVKAVKRQEPVSTCFPTAMSTKSFESISNKLLDIPVANVPTRDGLRSFVKRLANIFGN